MQLRQLELVDRENCGIYFDTQNPHALNGLDAPSLIEPIFNHIPEFHIKDGFDQISPHLIGEGSCDPFRSLAEFDRLRLYRLDHSGELFLARPAVPARR